MAAEIVLVRAGRNKVIAVIDGLHYERVIMDRGRSSTIKEAMEKWAIVKCHLLRGERPPWAYAPEVEWKTTEERDTSCGNTHTTHR